MQRHPVHRSAGGYILLLALPLLSASCSYVDSLIPQKYGHQAHTASKQGPAYQAADFVQHLSLASLALSGPGPDVSAARPDLAVLQAYTAAPLHGEPRRDNVRQMVVILECKSNDGGLRRLAAPYEKDPQWVLELLTRLDAKTCPLNNLWPATVTVKRGNPMAFGDATPQSAANDVHARLDPLIQGADKFEPLNEAQLEMGLTRAFIDAHQRDAAYIALENAKHALAAAESVPENKDKVKGLLDDLTALEAELHTAMPFTL